MPSEIEQAFAHPDQRSIATADPSVPDRISLRDHVVEAEIGAFQQERGTRQRLCFNVVVEVSAPQASARDDVDLILSYDKVTEAIAAALAAERLNLLETLAERIADRVLREPQAIRVFIRIEKLDRGPGALGVEIVRRRHDRGDRPAEADGHPEPVVAFLSNQAIGAASIAALVDGLAVDGAALILCVGLPETPGPRSRAQMAQRRIDLLSIEQNAWVLAGRDPRCVVVATRTELDWAIRHGQICVWAPSKIYLDAVERPSVAPRDGSGLAAWFAKVVGASELVLVGAPLVDADVPVRSIAVEDLE